ncbi:hypothetical protein [Burkholderia multivorans]|uniref:hypothetical protein n=1 Tax=Burkholderia multivorans TaxID=87883 RepID=UPI0012D96660|nr:hypothetical protein [Burkholderia multivorans]MBU9248727.1 hypothetical protein [Burkholderia multivorans]MBU9254604.1 hypothetical protein [Burkholderia multivorans]MDN7756300.1 hypothetical protein [Burkholderia multivorans]MDN8099115.1 hypothetical protein [Burkholderia multivorans]
MPNLGLGNEEILRLIALYLAAFLLSFLCFVSIKAFVMIFVAYFYGGGFLWASNDTRFVLVNGVLLGLVFLRFRNGGFCAKKMIRDAVVKSYSIGICTMLLCISIGPGRDEDCTQID